MIGFHIPAADCLAVKFFFIRDTICGAITAIIKMIRDDSQIHSFSSNNLFISLSLSLTVWSVNIFVYALNFFGGHTN